MNNGYGRLGKKGALWSRSYFAVNVGGEPIAVLKKYIQSQRE
jgi:REP element-mobilizing transposase RayT